MMSKPGLSESQFVPLNVLVADDGLVNRRLASHLLRKDGHSVAIACDGAHAVRKLNKNCFDLVLMDVEMPVMDGLAATRVIRQQEQAEGRHTLVVALTTNSNRDECLASGMDAFLNKPLNIGALHRVLANVAPGRVA